MNPGAIIKFRAFKTLSPIALGIVPILIIFPSAGDIIRFLSSLDRKLIKDIRIFDLYEGEKISENEKAVGVYIILQPEEMT